MTSGIRSSTDYKEKAELYLDEWPIKTIIEIVISATPYDELVEYYGDGNWTKKQFAEKHILFFGRSGLDSYLKIIFQK